MASTKAAKPTAANDNDTDNSKKIRRSKLPREYDVFVNIKLLGTETVRGAYV